MDVKFWLLWVWGMWVWGFGEFVCWCEFCLLVWGLFVGFGFCLLGVVFGCWWVLVGGGFCLLVGFVCWWVLVVVCGYCGFCWRCCNF